MRPHHHGGLEHPKLYKQVENEVILYLHHPAGKFGKSVNASTLGSLFDSELRGELEGIQYDDDNIGIQFPTSSRNTHELTVFTLALKDGISIETFLAKANKYIDPSYKSVLREIQDGVFLGRAATNSYLSGSSHTTTGVHGPGRIARPTFLEPAELRKMKIKTGELPNTKAAKSSGCSVDIYILDTIPPQSRIRCAWNTWGGNTLQHYGKMLQSNNKTTPHIYETEKAHYYYGSGFGENIRELMVVDGHHPERLRLHRRLQDDHSNLPYIAHEYDTSDHGLFIASIIHNILPEAELFVIQVLNAEGIGTLSSFIAGFKKVAELEARLGASENVVINCSFSLSLGVPDEINGVAMLLNEMQKCVLDDHKIMVAAAGNDSQRSPTNLGDETGYPAKWGFVVGVGALGKDGKPAKYSNKSDKPEQQGFMVFGGDYDDEPFTAQTTAYTGEGTGIIGVFTGDFAGNLIGKTESTPVEIVPNKNGFAEWAGTSFAAPIVSAMLAQKLCEVVPLSGRTKKRAAIEEIHGKTTPDETTEEPRLTEVKQEPDTVEK